MIISAGVKKFLGTALALLLAAGFGAGVVFAVKWVRDREAREAVLNETEIAENKADLVKAEESRTATTTVLTSAVGGFRSSARVARADPKTPTSTLACFKEGEDVVTKCEAQKKASDSVIALLYRRDTLLTESAVRARRGRFIAPSLAVGYAPYMSAPALRAAVDINFAQHWNLTATTDVAMKYRMGNGNPKTEWHRTDFVGLNYRFGGR